jgi:Holliday junction DNA helicase RuvA
MIGSLRGRVVEKSLTWVLLEVGGIGYKVFLSSSLLSDVRGEGETFLYIHDHIREDARDLYGFLTLGDLELFQRLINISGIGPKAAANILSLGARFLNQPEAESAVKMWLELPFSKDERHVRRIEKIDAQ